jgi:hypothetical protein
MFTGVNRKYFAEKRADAIHGQADGGLWGNHLRNRYCQDIQASNPYYHDAMDICRVMDLGSGQLNISGIKMLRKGIEGNDLYSRWGQYFSVCFLRHDRNQDT